MQEKTISGDCSECESTYNVTYITELASDEYPQHCPFCGSQIEEVVDEYIDDDDFDENEEWQN
jgi:DNA-directed RNA polymerase subunit RPC12/RpoP